MVQMRSRPCTHEQNQQMRLEGVYLCVCVCVNACREYESRVIRATKMIFVHPIATVNQAKYRDLQERHSTPYCAC